MEKYLYINFNHTLKFRFFAGISLTIKRNHAIVNYYLEYLF